MALELYSDRFWYTSGDIVTGALAYVFPKSSNSLASLFSDAAGTTPLANPLMTDGAGFLTFYAAVGEYWINISANTFLVSVGVSQEQADLTTGIASGGELDVAGATSITIHPLIGYIVDNSNITSVAPTITKIDYPGATVSLAGASLTRTITWWLLSSSQVVSQQATRPTAAQRRTHIVLGATIYDLNTTTLVEAQTLPTILPQQGNQLADLMDSLGPFSITGNVLSANGANLQVNKSAGTIFARAFHLFVSGVINDNPHVSDSPAQTPATFRRILRTVSDPTPSPVTVIDPANYDVGGVLTPVGGGVNSSTIQRFWLFANNDVSLQLLVQYGQTVYSSLANAAAAIGSGTFTPSPIVADAALIGYLVVTRTATDLSNAAQASFVKAGKFATP